jgi:hypothetical protein
MSQVESGLITGRGPKAQAYLLPPASAARDTLSMLRIA